MSFTAKLAKALRLNRERVDAFLRVLGLVVAVGVAGYVARGIFTLVGHLDGGIGNHRTEASVTEPRRVPKVVCPKPG